jgi:MFS transporter, ACS family, tartrate transporter
MGSIAVPLPALPNILPEHRRRMPVNGPTLPGRLFQKVVSRFSPARAKDLPERTRRRVTLYLIPFLFFLYILAYLDRVNVSVAQLKMELPPEDGGLGFTPAISGWGAGIFFWGYWILEVPSTVSVVRWGARWVFVRILILWGLCAALVGTIGTPFAAAIFNWMPHVPEHIGGDTARFINQLPENAAYQFYVFRFMLGFFEGGFFPSVIVYLSLWFRTEDRAKAIASFMAAIPLSSMLGLPLSGLLLDVHWFGLQGWRWIFILEGVAPFLAGFATIFFLPDRPAKATWLSAEERDWLMGELEREQRSKQGHGGHWAWVHHLGMVLLLTSVYFCLNFTSYGLSMFMPRIIKSQSGASDKMASLLASLPYLLGFIGILVNGWHSDKTRERPWHVAVPLTMLSLGIWLVAAVDGIPVLPVLVMIFCVGTFMYAHLPAFWPMPTMFLGATVAAGAIGFINMIGNLGGSIGPMVVGKEATGRASFASALVLLAPGPMIAAAIILIVGRRVRATKTAATPEPDQRRLLKDFDSLQRDLDTGQADPSGVDAFQAPPLLKSAEPVKEETQPVVEPAQTEISARKGSGGPSGSN